MKPLVVYHKDCADGFGAAFAAWRVLRDTADYLPFDYGNPPDTETWVTQVTGRDVYLLDVSPKRDLLDLTVEYAEYTVWLDHHDTSFVTRGVPIGRFVEDVDGLRVVLDKAASGAILAWEYFHGWRNTPALLQHVDDRDRWQFKLSGTREIMETLFARRPWSFAQWAELIDQWEEINEDLYRGGEILLAAREQQVKLIVESCARPCKVKYVRLGADGFSPVGPADFGGPDGGCNTHVGLATNCPPHLISDVGHALAAESGTYGLLWYVDSAGKVRVSLRSEGDYDVSGIAKRYGGGGHKNAAGFTATLEDIAAWTAGPGSA